MELLLDQGIQATGWFIEHQELRAVHERLQEAELLLVPFGELGGLPVQIQIQPLCQLVDIFGLYRAADGRKVFKHASARGSVLQVEFAREVTDPAAQSGSGTAWILPQH